MTDEIKIAVFKKLLDEFETDEMRLYCEDMIKQIPDYIFEMPSSTTGKYHNKTQCLPHGQIYHIIMFGTILNYRLSLKCNQEKFKFPEQRDAMRCVPIFHDALKCGWDGGAYTVHEHPILAAEWVKTAKVEHDISKKIKEAIADMCAAHSGQWTTSNKSKTVLPEPSNAMEIVIHECDYLSSRVDIDMTIPKYLNDIFVDEPVKFDPDYVLSFGKYSGRKLVDVYKKHPDYVDWMEENIYRKDVLNQIKVMKESLKKNED